MAGTNPERGDTGIHTRFTAPFRGIVDVGVSIANCAREWYEIGQVEKRSRRYVDALIECVKTGGITPRQAIDALSDNERIRSLQLDVYEVKSHAISRMVRLSMLGR